MIQRRRCDFLLNVCFRQVLELWVIVVVTDKTSLYVSDNWKLYRKQPASFSGNYANKPKSPQPRRSFFADEFSLRMNHMLVRRVWQQKRSFLFAWNIFSASTVFLSSLWSHWHRAKVTADFSRNEPLRNAASGLKVSRNFLIFVRVFVLKSRVECGCFIDLNSELKCNIVNSYSGWD